MQSNLYSRPILINHQFSQQVFGPQMPNFVNLRLMEAELFHADGQT